MSILVYKDGANWVEWHGEVSAERTMTTYNAQYADGRVVEMPCDPYPVPVNLNGDRIKSLYDQGIWSLEEIEAVGGRIAVPFTVPEGKQTVGNPTYAEQGGDILQQFAVEDIPPPPTPPTPQEKVASMLSNWDISISELKDVLGLGI